MRRYKLIERVEAHELNAGRFVERVLADGIDRFGVGRSVTFVAITMRRLDDSSVCINELPLWMYSARDWRLINLGLLKQGIAMVSVARSRQDFLMQIIPIVFFM